jgi:ergothioneine biosynthesis protein EgtC
MCRFTFYAGPPIRLSALVTEPRHSLIHQSYKAEEREEPLNGDGFGVAWYEPERSEVPAQFRSVTPAWNNRNLRSIAPLIDSPCILAHVRAASRGSVQETNCHPFVHGKLAFMHNGDVGGFGEIRRALAASLSDDAYALIEGRTDSEHIFALFVDELAKLPALRPLDAMQQALELAVGHVLKLVEEHAPGSRSRLNLVVSDGSNAVATRFVNDDPKYADSLYVNSGRVYECVDGMGRMVEPVEDHHAVLVSSEPLDDDPNWQPIPVGQCVLIERAQDPKLRSFTPR